MTPAGNPGSHRGLPAWVSRRGYPGLALVTVLALGLVVVDIWQGRSVLAAGLIVAVALAVAVAVPPREQVMIARHVVLGLLLTHQVILLSAVDASPAGLILLPLVPLLAILCDPSRRSLLWIPITAAAVVGLRLDAASDGAGPMGTEGLAYLALSLLVVAGFGSLIVVDRVRRRERRQTEQARAHRLAAANAMAEERLKDALDDQSWLLAALSHELRTPLMSMMLSAELLQMSAEDDEQRNIAHSLGRGVEALTSVLDDVGDLSRVGSGEIELNTREFAVQSLVEESVALMAPLAADHNTLLVADIDPRMCAAWVGDPARIRQVIVNLLGGAVKRADEGVIAVTATESEEHQLEIAVVDAGAGSTAEAIDLLFGARSQDDIVVQPREVGRGLGPAIARELTEVLGGELLVRTSPEGGCRFTLRCCDPVPDGGTVLDHNPAPAAAGQSFALDSSWGPIFEPATRRALRWMAAWGFLHRGDTAQRVDLAPADARHRHVVELAAQFLPSDPESEAAGGLPSNNRAIRVGVVDDDPSARNMMARSLEALGYQAVAIPSGLEAISVAEGGEVDVLLLDVHMPGVGGLETLRRLRARESGAAEMPICMVSGNAVNERASEEAGANRFLLKPVRVNVLGSVLHELLPRSEHPRPSETTRR